MAKRWPQRNYVFLFFCLKWYVFKHAFSVMNSSSAFGYKERSISRKGPRVQLLLEHKKTRKSLLLLLLLQAALLLK